MKFRNRLVPTLILFTVFLNACDTPQQQWDSLLIKAEKATQNNEIKRAEDYYQRAFSLTERLPPNDLRRITSPEKLAEFYRNQQQPKRAITFYLKALKTWEDNTTFSKPEKDRLKLLVPLAQLYRQQKDITQSLSTFQLAINQLKKQTDQSSLASLLHETALTYAENGNDKRAERIFKQVMKHYQSNLKHTLADEVHLLTDFADFYQSRQRANKGIPLLKRSLQLMNAAKTPAKERLSIMWKLAELHQQNQQHEAVRQLYQQTLTLANSLPQSKIKQQVYQRLGHFYFTRGQYTKARAHTQNALQLMTPTHPKYSQTVWQLGKILHYLGYFNDSLALLENTLKIPEITAEQQQRLSILLAESLTLLGQPERALNLLNDLPTLDNLSLWEDIQQQKARIHRQWEQFQQASALLESAIGSRRQRLGAEHPQLEALNHSAIQNQLQQAQYHGPLSTTRSLIKDTQNLLENTQGMTAPSLSMTYAYSGDLWQQQKRWKQADIAYEQAQHLRENAFGASHPDTALNYLKRATLYSLWQQNSKSNDFFDWALNHAKQYQSDSPLRLPIWQQQAAHLARQGQYPQALTINQRALSLSESLHGKSHHHTLNLLEQRAKLLTQHGQWAKADTLYQSLLKQRHEQALKNPLQTARIACEQANLWRLQKRLSEAQKGYQSCLKRIKNHAEPYHPVFSRPYAQQAQLYIDQKDYSAARKRLNTVLKLHEEKLGKHAVYVIQQYAALARVFLQEGQFEQAETLYSFALNRWQEANYPEDFHYAHLISQLADLYLASGTPYKALPLYSKALKILKKPLKTHPDLARLLIAEADAWVLQDKTAQARHNYQQALHIQEDALVPHHPVILSTLNKLQAVLKTQGNLDYADKIHQRIQNFSVTP